MAPKNAATKETIIALDKANFFLLIYLRELFFRFRVEGTEKRRKKALKMTS